MREASEIDDLAARFIVYVQNANNPGYWTGLPTSERESDMGNFVFDPVIDQPEDTWRFILSVVERDRNGETFPLLSAGSLEDLLSQHGARFIDRVEGRARANPRFASLLGGVWKSRMADDVWDRVVAARDRRGWDGEPVPRDHWWYFVRGGDEEAHNPLWTFLTDPQMLREFVSENTGLHVTPRMLSYAAHLGDPEVVRILLDIGERGIIDAFAPDTGWTPLMAAAEKGDLTMVAFLLQAGANVNAHDEARWGDTALMLAVQTSDYETAKLLIEQGADPTIPSFMRQTPLDVAREGNRAPELVELLSRPRP